MNPWGNWCKLYGFVHLGPRAVHDCLTSQWLPRGASAASGATITGHAFFQQLQAGQLAQAAGRLLRSHQRELMLKTLVDPRD